MRELKVYKTHPDVVLPKYGTAQAACFDLAYNPAGKTHYKAYTRDNILFEQAIYPPDDLIILDPGVRALIPTGLIFDIPEGWSIRVHPRSGLALKQGLILSNCEGVIDSDYFHETFIMTWNTSNVRQMISPGDRIAQAEVVPVIQVELVETTVQPVQKTDRIGGYGSTGVSETVKKHWPDLVKEENKELVYGR